VPKNATPFTSHPLEYIFHPRSIAVVGISEDLPKLWIRRLYLDSLVQSKFPGQLYLVNPRGGEMAGFPIYRTLTEVPGPVDHVVVSIPAVHTPALLEECRAKGVKVVHVFSSGYAETGEPDRIELQNKLVEIARQGNMRIIGPNCLGIYYPKGRIGLSPDFPMDAGSIGYLCQSGGNVDFTVRHATARGLRFSKVVSYGNASDINECDLLDYFAWDPETKVIAAYIEGISDGRRFADALKEAAAAKPVVVFKGGYTAGGLRAAASHTGSLAGADVVWNGLLKQAGAIRVYSVEEMVDVLVALLRVTPPKGINTCVLGNGGGASVMATDEVERAGLRMAPMPAAIRDQMKEFIDLANSMLRNPVDVSPLAAVDGFNLLREMGLRKPVDVLRDRAAIPLGGNWGRLNEVLKEWPDLDLVVFQHGFDISPMPIDDFIVVGSVGPLVLAARECQMPKAVVLHSMGNDQAWRSSESLRGLAAEFSLPVFLSMRGAANAIRKLIDYSRAYPDRLAGVRDQAPRV
jgi:acyl-CoA synthetase (NDP forming)